MRKSWKFVGMLVVVVLVLGGVLIGVGFLTGANKDRIDQVADAALGITETVETIRSFFNDPHSFELFLQNLTF